MHLLQSTINWLRQKKPIKLHRPDKDSTPACHHLHICSVTLIEKVRNKNKPKEMVNFKIQ